MNDIITFGRAGTPMPAWGIEGGGPKNDQAISDLVEYLKSIQLSPAKARAQVLKNVADAEGAGEEVAVTTAEKALADAEDNLAKAETAKAPARVHDPDRRGRRSRSSGPGRSRTGSPTRARASSSSTSTAPAATRRAGPTTSPTKPLVPPPAPTGSGALGPSLRGGSTLEQFPGLPADDTKTPGFQKQYDWVANGVEEHKGYGVRGISTGRMPHFASILTKDQIDEIIKYERNL